MYGSTAFLLRCFTWPVSLQRFSVGNDIAAENLRRNRNRNRLRWNRLRLGPTWRSRAWRALLVSVSIANLSGLSQPPLIPCFPRKWVFGPSLARSITILPSLSEFQRQELLQPRSSDERLLWFHFVPLSTRSKAVLVLVLVWVVLCLLLPLPILLRIRVSEQVTFLEQGKNKKNKINK